MSFIEREKEHVEGFAPELAVVTKAGGKELEESLVIRPTSETIIYSMYSKWVQSYRDLPILMNQWANVMRWEMRTRLFLRTSEFLWQEGHTAHATPQEAEEETLLILDIYRRFMEDWIAMPPITGLKTETEKFAGAVRSYACEALMQDRKALQAGTSHFLGQNFSRQFDLKFQSEAGQEEYAWNTSWGVSTRMVGGLVMTHGDDAGIVVPPRLAPVQVVIVPILRGDDTRAAVLEKVDEVSSRLRESGVRVKVDSRDNLSPGAKFYEWERKGVPFRLELGPKDLEKGSVAMARRVIPEGARRKEFVPEAEAVGGMPARLEAFQKELCDQAIRRRDEDSVRGVKSYWELQEALDGGAGFVFTGWNGDPAVEQKIKDMTKATSRVIPDEEFASEARPETCVSGEGPAKVEVAWARAY
jgi:prolyl-tRNA synthetase